MIRRDTLWKGVIEDFFPEMIAWFYPDHIEYFDFTRIEFLDKELAELFPDSETSDRRADKLVKVWLNSGEERWVLIHIEVQGYKDNFFEERMFQYYYRLYDRYKIRIEPLVILTDPHSDYHPRQFEIRGYESQLLYRFFSYKLLSQPQEAFADFSNPFSIVMRTAWEAIRGKNIPDESLLELKTQLFRNLLEAGYDKKTINRLSRFIKNYASFQKKDMVHKLDENISNLTNEVMARGIIERVNEEYKRIAREEGLKEGLEEGLEQGREQKEKEIILRLLKKGFSVDDIAGILEVPAQLVQEIKSGNTQDLQ